MTLSVVHLANHCDRGGNVHLAVDLACEQAERGHRVAFASSGGRYVPLLARCGVSHVQLDQSLRHPWSAARSAAALVALCRARRPDVLHAHMMSGAVLGRVAGRICGVPLVTTVHNSFDPHSWLMRVGDAVVAVSAHERDLLLARGYPRTRVATIVNGILGSARRAESGTSELRLPRPLILTMSGLERRKGVHDVIDAFGRVAARAPGWHLAVAGDGPERTALEAQARGSAGAARISFLGHVEDTAAVLAQTDIFVLASYAEPFGLGVLEAREAGCAVVGSRVGGIAEQLAGDRFGLTVPPARPDLLAGCLLRLMTDPAALATAQRAAQQELETYSVGRMANEYLDLYRTVRSAHGRRAKALSPATARLRS